MEKHENRVIEYTIEVEQDDTSIQGNVLASGDDTEDRKAERWVIDQLNSGNVWAWASVKVTARIGRFTGVDYLGCCSYESEEAFRGDVYFRDMQREAYAELVRNLKRAVDEGKSAKNALSVLHEE